MTSNTDTEACPRCESTAITTFDTGDGVCRACNHNFDLDTAGDADTEMWFVAEHSRDGNRMAVPCAESELWDVTPGGDHTFSDAHAVALYTNATHVDGVMWPTDITGGHGHHDAQAQFAFGYHFDTSSDVERVPRDEVPGDLLPDGADDASSASRGP